MDWQVVKHTLLGAHLIPIPIKVQQLQRLVLESPNAFTIAWNWIDAYLRLEHDEAVYRMLRQVRSRIPHSHAQRPHHCTQTPGSGTPPTAR